LAALAEMFSWREMLWWRGCEQYSILYLSGGYLLLDMNALAERVLTGGCSGGDVLLERNALVERV
jgi:hypothetical protein